MSYHWRFLVFQFLVLESKRLHLVALAAARDSSLAGQAKKTPKKPWTEEEDAIVREHVSTIGIVCESPVKRHQ